MLSVLWLSAVYLVRAGSVPSEVPSKYDNEYRLLSTLLKPEQILIKPNGVHALASLEETLKLALIYSVDYSLKLGQQISESRLRVSEKRLTPLMITSFDAGSNTFAAGAGAPGSSLLIDNQSTAVSTSYLQEMPKGWKYQFSYKETRSAITPILITKPGRAPKIQKMQDPIHSSSLTAGVEIPVFQDWGEINQVSDQEAQLQLEQSLSAIEEDRSSVLLHIGNLYWDLVGSLLAEKVREEGLALSKQLFQESQKRVKAGVQNATELNVIRAQIARDEQALLAQQIQSLKVEDLARAALKLELPNIRFVPTDLPKDHPVPIDNLPWKEEIFKADSTLKSLKIQEKQNQLSYLRIQNQEKPNVDVGFSYTVNGYGTQLLEGVRYFDQLPLHDPGIRVTWTVPFNGDQIREQKQQQQLEQAQIQEHMKLQRLRLNVKRQSLLNLLSLAEKDMDATKVSMNAVKQQLTDEVARLKAGESTNFRVAQVQQDVATASLQYTLAKINYEKAYLEFLTLTGTLLSHFGLE